MKKIFLLLFCFCLLGQEKEDKKISLQDINSLLKLENYSLKLQNQKLILLLQACQMSYKSDTQIQAQENNSDLNLKNKVKELSDKYKCKLDENYNCIQ